MLSLEKFKFFALDRFFKFGSDFIILNDYFNGSNFFNDFVWNLSNRKFFDYVISNPDSCLRLRQFAASCYRFTRLLSALEMSALDYGLSKAFHPLISRDAFSSRRSKERALRRIMTVLKRNGGVYEDIFDFVLNFAGINYQYEQLLSRISLRRSASNAPATREEAAALLRDELGVTADDLSDLPDDVAGPFTMYDAVLPNIGEVTVSVIPKRTARMRRFDLLPFRLIRLLVSPFRSLRPERALLDILIARMSKTAASEAAARRTILERFGVDFSQPPATVFRRARELSRHVYVPAPIPTHVSEHVMVTDRQIHGRARSAGPAAFKGVARFTRDLVRHRLLLPNVGLSNLRRSGNTVSFATFSPLAELPEGRPLQHIGRLAAGALVRNEELVSDSAEYFGIDRQCAVDSALYSKQPLLSLTRQLMRSHADVVAPAAEAVFALAAQVAGPARRTASVSSSIYSLFTNPVFKLV